MRDDRARLLDILEAIEHIEKYASKGREAFEQDELVQVWFLRHLQIIGEAARFLSDGIKDNQPDIPWGKIIGMRNILVHHYFDIDLPVVWMAVSKEMPELKRRVTAMLKKLEGA